MESRHPSPLEKLPAPLAARKARHQTTTSRPLFRTAAAELSAINE